MSNPNILTESTSSSEYTSLEWLLCFEGKINPALEAADDYRKLPEAISSKISDFMLFRHQLRRMNPEFTERIKPVLQRTLKLLEGMNNCSAEIIKDLQEFIDTPTSEKGAVEAVREELNGVFNPYAFLAICEVILDRLRGWLGKPGNEYFQNRIKNMIDGTFKKDLIPSASLFSREQAERVNFLINRIIELLKNKKADEAAQRVEESTVIFMKMLQKRAG